MKTSEKFFLTKWYLDCITEAGNACILYVALLKWRGLSLHYSSILLFDKYIGVQSDTSLRRCRLPQVEGSRIRWSSGPLGVVGEWDALCASVEREWGEENRGTIRWSCLQPGAKVDLRVGADTRLEGMGYVERLTMSIAPWHLSFKELRWGHFISEGETLVWIDWKGAAPLSLVVRNGIEIPACSISDKEIRDEDDRLFLRLSESAVLRKGPLLSTTLSMIPGVSTLFPKSILHTVECKWISRGKLLLNKTQPISGWAINEAVKFP
jgi:hypothetical protein